MGVGYRPGVTFALLCTLSLHFSRYGTGGVGGGVKNLRFWRYVICGRSLSSAKLSFL